MFFALTEFIRNNPGRRNKIFLLNLGLVFIVNLIMWLLLIVNFWQRSDYIILGYNIYFGISDLGVWYEIYLLPLVGLIIAVINFLLALYFYLPARVLSYFLAFTASIINFILFVASLLLVYSNL